MIRRGPLHMNAAQKWETTAVLFTPCAGSTEKHAILYVLRSDAAAAAAATAEWVWLLGQQWTSTTAGFVSRTAPVSFTHTGCIFWFSDLKGCLLLESHILGSRPPIALNGRCGWRCRLSSLSDSITSSVFETVLAVVNLQIYHTQFVLWDLTVTTLNDVPSFNSCDKTN